MLFRQHFRVIHDENAAAGAARTAIALTHNRCRVWVRRWVRGVEEFATGLARGAARVETH
jgi:hypothetical protein